MKKWLRKIYLLPFSILMGVGDGELSAEALEAIAGPEERPLNERIMAFAGHPDAQFMSTELEPDASASKDEAEDADLQGKQGEEADEGLDTQADEADQDADLDEDSEADESNESEADNSEEVKEKGTKKRTLEERAAEIAQKIVEQELAKRDQRTAEDKPDWVPIVQEKVDEHIAAIEAQIDELRLEGKYGEARKLSRSLDKLDADLEENEKRRLAWEDRQKVKQTTTDSGEAARKELDEAAELYRGEMKIEPDVWQKMGEWFETQIAAKPLLVAEFNDIFQKQGKVAAIRFAHEYTVKNMGQKVKQDVKKKEETKTKTSQLTTTTLGKAPPVDLKKAHAEYAANPTPEAFVKYQAAKRAARGA